MADAQYQFGASIPPSGLSWDQSFSWSNARAVAAGSEIIVTNSDGTITRILGTGLAINSDGEPTAGTVTELYHMGSNILLTYTSFVNLTTGPSLADLRAQGIGAWILPGNDIINSSNAVANANVFGGNGNDVLQGDNTDKLYGGLGIDSYIINAATVQIIEAVGSGLDTADVQMGVASYTLAANVETLFYSGTASFKGIGNALDNSLQGNSGSTAADTFFGLAGNDSLIGWGGNDTLTGGTGNDVYHVEDAGDKVIEIAGQGTDTIFVRSVLNSLTSFVLPANVENITHEAGFLSGAIKLTGNTLNNIITGSGLAGDELIGLSGNDTLDGSGGADTLAGGLGNDNYIDSDGDDTITELAGAGIDTVTTTAGTYTLGANIENVILLSAGSATGNALANRMTLSVTGGTLLGAGGNDTLDATAFAGGSFLSGGTGNDTYIVDDQTDTTNEASNNAGEGSADTVISYASLLTLQSFIERGRIAGGTLGTMRELTGNADANLLTGDVSDDILDGGAGNDSLAGGKGNDTYKLDSTGDKITEAAGAGSGIDTVKLSGMAFATYTLGANIENLELSSALSATGRGNALANKLTGSNQAGAGDKLFGLDGNDELWGNSGVDTLVGGKGHDTYVLLAGFDEFDVIQEIASQGSDTIRTDFMTVDLNAPKYANIENVTGTGGGFHVFTGTAVANTITGDSNTDELHGAGGNDRLLGLANADTIYGDAGNDTIDGGSEADQMYGGIGNDTFIVDSSADSVFENAAEGIDTIRTALSMLTIGSDEVENLVYTGSATFFGAGNAKANKIFGGSLADQLNGNGGADTLVGARGDDTYVIDNAGDKAVELAAQGLDTIKIFDTSGLLAYTLGANAANVENLTYIGADNFRATGNGLRNAISTGAGADKLFGLDGNDTLDGGAGADQMTGGKGSDTYLVDDAGDTIVELANAGTDTIYTSLSTFSIATSGLTNVERLTFTGAGASTLTGNGLANRITGGNDVDVVSGLSGNDVLYGLGGTDQLDGGNGNDTIDGGAGGDAMAGGAGNDLYYVDDASDTIIELSGTPDETSLSLSNDMWTMSAGVERALFIGVGNLVITGSAQANTIIGGAGADTIDGGAGADIMSGKGGDDTYTVDTLLDKIIEAAGGGLDTVKTNLATYSLGANVDNLTFTTGGAHTGTGNTLNNMLAGDAGDDTLIGLAGNDILAGNGGTNILIGGLGNDEYLISSATDTISEIAGQGTDKIRTSLTTFDMSATAANVENIAFMSGGNVVGTGNAANNEMSTGGGADKLHGLAGNDVLKSGAGDDSLEGGLGNDSLWGGTGDDDFLFKDGAGQGTDVVSDFLGAKFSGNDDLVIDSSTINVFADLVFAGAGQNVFQDINGARIVLDATTSILVLGYKTTDLMDQDFVFV